MALLKDRVTDYFKFKAHHFDNGQQIRVDVNRLCGRHQQPDLILRVCYKLYRLFPSFQ